MSYYGFAVALPFGSEKQVNILGGVSEIKHVVSTAIMASGATMASGAIMAFTPLAPIRRSSAEFCSKFSKQLEVKQYFKDIGLEPLSYDKTATKGCSFRPDFKFETRDRKQYVMVEVDEGQHRRHKPERDIFRMRFITKNSDKPVIWIRYNPDSIEEKAASLSILGERLADFLRSPPMVPDGYFHVEYVLFDNKVSSLHTIIDPPSQVN